jgi:mannan endo-1,4-beta-mannosidase
VKTRHLLVIMAVFVTSVFGYALAAPHRTATVSGGSLNTAAPSPTGPPPAYDVKPLLSPARDYLGVALSGAPQDMSRVDKWADRVSARPNIITIYQSFDDPYAAAEIRKIFRYGALPIVRWEPFRQSMASIAKGDEDAYITEFAKEIRRVNIPIALTIAHEMNGHWYPWGTTKTKPADFVAAWKRIHQLFQAADATNVIWTWTPNVVNPVPSVKLQPLYPGDSFVDWVGIDGYFTRRSEKTFAELFGPTMQQVRTFTKKPFLIVETGSEPGTMRTKAVNELFTACANGKDILGFVYFNQKGSGDWSLDGDPSALAAYRVKARTLPFGFPIK